VTGGPVATAAPEPNALVEARNAPRLPASAVPGIKGVRLSPHGTEATLLNISASGVLVECTSRIRLGTAVTTVFEGTFSPATIEGRVARSSVANVSKKGVLQYHIGIAFNSRIAIGAPPAVEQPPVVEPALAAAKPQPQAPETTGATTTPLAQNAAPLPPVLRNRW